MEIFGYEYLRAMLSPEMQASLTEKMLVVYLIWITMGRKVDTRFKELTNQTQVGISRSMEQFQTHFEKIEKSLASAVDEMRELKEAVAEDFSIHSKRLMEVEGTIQGLSNRVERLESTKGE